MSRSGPARLDRTDTRVLRHLDESGADYPALIASNTGLHVPHVERRIADLRDDGYVEKVSNEAIYRITASGTDVLAGASDRASD